ncbi:MAG TPA: CoA transferase [Hyphomicrobiales bacterium]|nr:CoA transferase [Hyphomicrobiales bacterium]
MVPKFLEGVRITDLTWAGAGPYSTKVFSDLGAEVLKVESRVRPDPVRGGKPYKDGVPGLDRSGYFASRNNGKKSVAVDLKSPGARDLILALAAQSDVISNNFAPGAMERLKLGYEELRAVKPDIVYLGMPMYGEDGPLAGMLGVGMTIAAVAGMIDRTGYHDGPPLGPGTHFPDHAVNPYHAAFAVLAALRHRRLTGRGMKIDLAQVESTLNSMGVPFMEWSATGVEPAREGNRSRSHAPHNIFRCRSEDAWCAVAVLGDEEWQALCRTMGRDDLAGRGDLRLAEGRLGHVEEVEAAVAAWIAGRTPEEAMAELQAAGIAAGVVSSAANLMDHDPQLRARGYWQVIDHPEMGETRFSSPPYLVDGERVELKRPPLLGEHTEEVLARVLGYSPDRIAALRDAALLR